MKKANAFLAMGRFGQKLKSTVLKTVRKHCRKAFSYVSLPTGEAITLEDKAWHQDTEWEAATHQFRFQRLRLGLAIAIVSIFTFILRDIFQGLFHFEAVPKLTQEIQNLVSTINISIFLCLLGCLALHKTKIARDHLGLLFLCQSFSITLGEQIVATLKGFALPDQLAWNITFLTQATLIPMRWYLHIWSQLGVLIYYFVVNTTLGLKLPSPYNDHPIYDVTLILSVFWVCFICDLAVYLYESLQRSEFYARKELETAYQRLGVAEAKYRSIFENAVEGIFQSTPNGRYITANPALARIYGYSSPEEVTALTDIEHQLYVDPQRYGEFVRLIEQFGKVSGFESQIYRQDGSILWISEKAYAVRDQTGELLYYEGMIEDITKRKLAEAALQEQFDFLQVLIDTIPAPVFYQNSQGFYVGCNKAFEEALGLSKEQIIGKSVYDVAPKELADQYHQADKVLFEDREVQTYESSVVYKDGKKHDVIFYKATFSKADGILGGLVGVILDISERKRTEEALRVFFHAVSHDLRNPVLGTLMVLKNLLNGEMRGVGSGERGVGGDEGDEGDTKGTSSPYSPTPPSYSPTPDSRLPTPPSYSPTPHSPLPTPHSYSPTPDSRLPTPPSYSPTPHSPLPTPHSFIPVPASILERMVQSSDRQLNLINSLMEAHVNEVQGVVLQRERVQLYQVVDGAIADLEPMLAENEATLTNLVSVDLPSVNADPTQLWRVFSNLIVNAVKHNPPSLNITVNATVEGEKIFCTIADNGVGLSQQQCDRLFDLYFRGVNVRNSVSLGLGLYLCKQIITAHGGDIGVTSTLGAGAIFWFTLPVK